MDHTIQVSGRKGEKHDEGAPKPMGDQKPPPQGQMGVET